MKALFIGGTGTISTAVTALAREKGWEVTLLNRGSKPVPEGMESMIADIHDEAAVARIMEGRTYDVVAQFIAYGAEDVQRDIRLFQGKTRQYIFISSASAYQKPAAGCPITAVSYTHLDVYKRQPISIVPTLIRKCWTGKAFRRKSAGSPMSMSRSA